MRLADFKKANCPLFRTPTPDFSQVDGVIDNLLVEAWKSGDGPDKVVDYVLNKKGVTSQITDQIAENLAFQRYQQLDGLKEKEAKIDETVAQEQQEKEASAKAQMERELAEKENIYSQTVEQQTAKSNEYTASQSALEEMRSRIQSKLNEVGGEKNLMNLLEINRALIEGTDPKTQRETLAEKIKNFHRRLDSQPKAEKSTNLPVDREIIYGDITPPVSNPEDSEEGFKTLYQKNKEQTFTGKVWKVLNYKIW